LSLLGKILQLFGPKGEFYSAILNLKQPTWDTYQRENIKKKSKTFFKKTFEKNYILKNIFQKIYYFKKYIKTFILNIRV
jgi:hypothetical protein